MAEAIFAGEQVEKLAARDVYRMFRLSLAIVPRLAKHFFVRHRPGDAGDR